MPVEIFKGVLFVGSFACYAFATAAVYTAVKIRGIAGNWLLFGFAGLCVLAGVYAEVTAIVN